MNEAVKDAEAQLAAYDSIINCDGSLKTHEERLAILQDMAVAYSHAGEWEGLTEQLANERSNIHHCVTCGNSSYDSGFTTSCPICELVEERKEKQAALEEVFRLSGC